MIRFFKINVCISIKKLEFHSDKTQQGLTSHATLVGSEALGCNKGRPCHWWSSDLMARPGVGSSMGCWTSTTLLIMDYIRWEDLGTLPAYPFAGFPFIRASMESPPGKLSWTHRGPFRSTLMQLAVWDIFCRVLVLQALATTLGGY